MTKNLLEKLKRERFYSITRWVILSNIVNFASAVNAIASTWNWIQKLNSGIYVIIPVQWFKVNQIKPEQNHWETVVDIKKQYSTFFQLDTLKFNIVYHRITLFRERNI